MEKKHLNVAFGLAPAPTLSRPKIGSLWNCIAKWPNIQTKKLSQGSIIPQKLIANEH